MTAETKVPTHIEPNAFDVPTNVTGDWYITGPNSPEGKLNDRIQNLAGALVKRAGVLGSEAIHEYSDGKLIYTPDEETSGGGNKPGKLTYDFERPSENDPNTTIRSKIVVGEEQVGSRVAETTENPDGTAKKRDVTDAVLSTVPKGISFHEDKHTAPPIVPSRKMNNGNNEPVPERTIQRSTASEDGSVINEKPVEVKYGSRNGRPEADKNSAAAALLGKIRDELTKAEIASQEDISKNLRNKL